LLVEAFVRRATSVGALFFCLGQMMDIGSSASCGLVEQVWGGESQGPHGWRGTRMDDAAGGAVLAEWFAAVHQALRLTRITG
jgi:hypothetical protein